MTRRLVDISVKGKLRRDIGLTEVFSESAEPGHDEIPRADFIAKFPEGNYKFFGKPSTVIDWWAWLH